MESGERKIHDLSPQGRTAPSSSSNAMAADYRDNGGSGGLLFGDARTTALADPSSRFAND